MAGLQVFEFQKGDAVCGDVPSASASAARHQDSLRLGAGCFVLGEGNAWQEIDLSGLGIIKKKCFVVLQRGGGPPSFKDKGKMSRLVRSTVARDGNEEADHD